jgi:hypothetical protein
MQGQLRGDRARTRHEQQQQAGEQVRFRDGFAVDRPVQAGADDVVGTL